MRAFTLSRSRAVRRLLAAAAIGLSLAASPASAQVPGDRVRLETDAGVLDGTLIDRLPQGYLVRVGDTNRLVPYAAVKGISRLDPGSGAALPPEPPAAPAGPLPVIVVVPAPAPPYQPPAAPPPTYSAPRSRRSPELIATGASFLGLGILTLVVGGVLTPIGYAIKGANTCQDPAGNLHFQCEYGHGSALATAGVITLIAGGAITGGGIALLVAGVSTHSTASLALPRVMIAPRSATLTWTF